MTDSLALVPRSIEECVDLATRLAESSLLPAAMRGKIPDVLITIMAGQELGLPPMAALRSIDVIEGKPRLSSDVMVAIVLGSGKAAYFRRTKESAESVTYETLRIGATEPRTCTWTIAMAKTASLHLKDNWRGYPRAMLAARAKAELARDVYPDVLAGCYIEDEVDSGVTFTAPRGAQNTDVIDADFVEAAPEPEPPIFAEIDRADTEDQLKTLAEKLAALPVDQKARAKLRYKNRLGAIRDGVAARRAPMPPRGSGSAVGEIADNETVARTVTGHTDPTIADAELVGEHGDVVGGMAP